MSQIVLTLRRALTHPLEAGCVVPDRFATLSQREISVLPVWSAGEPRTRRELGEVFSIAGERAAAVRVQGDAALVEHLGRGMAGGRLEIEGNAGSGAGLEMKGGTLVVHGSAGTHLGGAQPGASRGMTGGEILVHGSAGFETGARMRRGMIFVGGNVGELAGRGMIAGTLVVGGALGADPGAFLKRGSLVALGAVPIPLTYRYACTYRPPHLRFILSRLRALYRAPITEAQITGSYRRFIGDLAGLGKGELLAWTTA